MSSDNDSKSFLPKSLKEWLETLKILVPVGLAIWAFLASSWPTTKGEVLVNTRLLLALTALLPMAFGVLWWHASRQSRRLKAFEDRRPVPVKLSSDEVKILMFFAVNDGQKIHVWDVSNHLQLPPVRFHYHWNRVFSEFGLLDHVGTSMGQPHYMLSHLGRKHVIENGLVV